MRSALRTHNGMTELALAIGLYAVYEIVRGFGSTTLASARLHTAEIVSLERHLGVFVERAVQQAVESLPAVPMLLGFAYMSLHFVSTAVSLAIYVLYPAAPPRLSGLGFADTVTDKAGINLSSDALGSLYNPFAAVPSLHFGYSLLVGVTVAALARRRWLRAIGAAYPPFMLFTIVATGNHFIFDALAGGIVMVVAYFVARGLVADAARPARATR